MGIMGGRDPPIVNSSIRVVVAVADAEVQVHDIAIFDQCEARSAVWTGEGGFVRGHAADIVEALGLVLGIGWISVLCVDGVGTGIILTEGEGVKEAEEENGQGE